MATLAHRGPYSKSVAVVPHATNPIRPDNPVEPVNAIKVGGAGTIACRLEGDSADSSFTVVAGETLQVRATHVRATGTTATGMTGVW